MIFNLYDRVLVKLGDERHEFDRRKLMYTEAAEIEKVTGLSYAEWSAQLGKASITAIAALLHVLRQRDGQPSDYKQMQFAAADLEVVPLHDDGSEFTAQEVVEDLARRVKDAAEKNSLDPTSAAGDAPAAAQSAGATTGTSPSSPNGSASGPGNGSTSPGMTSASARRTSTRS